MKNLLANINNNLQKAAGRTGLVLKKNSPEILLAVGVVSFIGTVVLACKATLKADEVLKHHEERINDFKEAKEIAENDETGEELDYDEELYALDCRNQTLKTGVAITKAYAPVVALGAFSLACILASRNILNKRYLGAVAAYNAVSEAFNTYRKRVVNEVGEVMDRHYRYGTELEEVKIAETTEDGKTKTKKELVEKPGTGDQKPSLVAVWFDESNQNWDPNPNFSLMFLRAVESNANLILNTRGHLFLNEVYDALGFPHTQSGAMFGWVKGMGDGYVDFGLYDPDSKEARAFINGNTNRILLDFNHDGIIWDKI